MQHTPRVYPASLDSQPSPLPLPQRSPMDFSYEFLMFQCGNHDTKERLEFYQSFIMRLLGEVKTLRETVRTSCQQKSASSKAAPSGNQLLAAPDDSMRAVEDSLPQMPEIEIFYPPASSPGSSSPPINEKITLDSSLLFKVPAVPTELGNESNDRVFYVERDALADTNIDVTFVHSFRRETRVQCVSFRPDGRYLAVVTVSDDKNGSIVIYEVESRKKYFELMEYASQYGSYPRPFPLHLCFSPDGRYLAAVDQAKRIIIWDVPKKRIRSIFHWSYEIYDVHFSPDGRLVVFQTVGEVVMLNIRDNSRRLTFEGGCFDFNPGGRLIATGEDCVLWILDVRTGKAVKVWNGHGRYLDRVKFTLDGRGLLCVYDVMVQQWDVSDTEPVLIREFDIKTDSIYGTGISPDHRLLTSFHQLWDVNGGKHQYTFKGHNGDVRSVDFSAAGTYLAIGNSDGVVSLWKYAWPAIDF